MKIYSKQKNTGFTHTLTFTKQLCCAPLAHCKSKCRGFTLVETLVAISIFTVSLLGIMSVLASSISNTGYAKKKVAAGYLAQEGIEYVRNMRDTDVLYAGGGDWTSFRTNSLDLSSLPSYSDPGFTRTIWKDTTGLGLDEVKVFSKVEWTQGSGNYSITFSENLFNWVE